MSNLRGAEEAIDAHNGVEVKAFRAVEGEKWDDDARAVDYIMKRFRLEGEHGEWLEGYRTEMGAVRDKRLEPVSLEVQERVLSEGNFVPLRMNPEPKRKTGRKKCRVIAQGFREPKGWDDGAADAPLSRDRFTDQKVTAVTLDRTPPPCCHCQNY